MTVDARAAVDVGYAGSRRSATTTGPIPRASNPAAIAETQVLRTVVAGRTLYEAPRSVQRTVPTIGSPIGSPG